MEWFPRMYARVLVRDVLEDKHITHPILVGIAEQDFILFMMSTYGTETAEKMLSGIETGTRITTNEVLVTSSHSELMTTADAWAAEWIRQLNKRVKIMSDTEKMPPYTAQVKMPEIDPKIYAELKGYAIKVAIKDNLLCCVSKIADVAISRLLVKNKGDALKTMAEIGRELKEIADCVSPIIYIMLPAW
jgi:hypothetical protein